MMKDYVYFEITWLPKGIRFDLPWDEELESFQPLEELVSFVFVGDGKDLDVISDDVLKFCPMRRNKDINDIANNVWYIPHRNYRGDMRLLYKKNTRWVYPTEDLWIIEPTIIDIYEKIYDTEHYLESPLQYEVDDAGWDYVLHGSGSYSDQVEMLIDIAKNKLQHFRDSMFKRHGRMKSRVLKQKWYSLERKKFFYASALSTGFLTRWEYEPGKLVSTMDGDYYDDPVYYLEGEIDLYKSALVEL